ncbi:hypothetical protein K523DRAFT_280794 [Schizophyllum commune Tattone D]|nr:uncharacterized protein SCHCODRAFT_02622691 [Schizophyllum commune H4-8]KAI4520462.1 hypothetical protein K525DRAFT_203673 [Schizophyllum commune Loenen D]KAI5826582.1 hypothetical protein K523DRAFT_280794 [Schizophyllum commune Tattone D]KAI5893759.1 hypothetical protein SCHCODRAFT_02622691 [Schizophyllum commune H4-8]
MENPHAERQAALLQRILKNVSKCNEAFHEVNTCMDEIIRANAPVKTAAELAMKYKRNVLYNANLEAGGDPKARP